MRRGSVHRVNLGATHPPEFGKTRPGLVMSNTTHNTVLESVVIVPISTRPDEIWPLRIDLEDVTGKRGFAVLPGIRQVSKSRLGDVITVIEDQLMVKVDEALAAYLGDGGSHEV